MNAFALTVESENQKRCTPTLSDSFCSGCKGSSLVNCNGEGARVNAEGWESSGQDPQPRWDDHPSRNNFPVTQQ
eukprot:1267049-Amphidinium_carterae.1